MLLALAASAPAWAVDYSIVDRDGKQLSFGELTDRLINYDFICVGESHDSAFDHEVQLQILKSIYARDENIGAGFEMFQRQFQPVLDKFATGRTNERQMLTGTEYQKRWGFDWSLYKRLIDFCRRNSIQLAALNAPRELTKRIAEVGISNLTPDEKLQLGSIDLSNEAHRKHWFEPLAHMHSHGNATAPDEGRKERSYQVMVVWDDFMAQSAANFLKARKLDHMLIFAGAGHANFRFGIPDRLATYANATVASVGILSGEESDGIDTDFVIRQTTGSN